MNESLFRISLMKLDFTSQREQHVLNCLGCLNFYKVEIKMSCKINYINTELYFKILNVMSNQLYNSKKLVINSYKLSRRVKRFWHPGKNYISINMYTSGISSGTLPIQDKACISQSPALLLLRSQWRCMMMFVFSIDLRSCWLLSQSTLMSPHQ